MRWLRLSCSELHVKPGSFAVAQMGHVIHVRLMPSTYSWPSLVKKDGDELFDHYRHTLDELGKQKGLLGLIFNKSLNKLSRAVHGPRPTGALRAINPVPGRIVQNPSKLRRLIVDLIDKGEARPNVR